MKAKLFLLLVLCLCFVVVACDDDDDNKSIVGGEESTFESLASPYLVCANRNPGGVGFDFEYYGDRGGANYMDSLTVDDFEQDILIRTAKAEKPDGTLAGMPYILLCNGTVAVNYSSIDAGCVGFSSYESLTATELAEFSYTEDANDFDLGSLATGETGKPSVSDMQAEFQKLVIGQRWKVSANNDVEDDEPIWIIQTGEGRLVKLIVTDFPADPAPTATGYIALEWDYLQ